MRILITNDDGIYSEGIKFLCERASELGEIIVVAPKVEQSGKSHGIEIKKAFEIKRVELFGGIEAYSVDSTPADCVRFAAKGLGYKYDLAISGINRGFNIGKDIMYSGTVGAVFESAFLGIKSLAISTSSQSFDSARANLDRIYAYITENDLLSSANILNVNIPLAVNGIRITRQGGSYYNDIFVSEEQDYYRQTVTKSHISANNPYTDTDSILDGYISISPLTTERTDVEAYRRLALLNK